MAPTQLPHTWRDLFRLDLWYSDLFHLVHYQLPKIVVTIILAFVLVRILNLVCGRLARADHAHLPVSAHRTQQLRTISSITRSVGLALIVFFALVSILYDLNIHVEPLIASAGIAGLAVGFGAQTLVHDVLNGFFILVENWFDVGDTIKVGSFQGTVETLTLHRTVLRDGDGSVHTIPNSTITAVTNLTRDWTQIALQVAVDYQESSERVIQLLQQITAAIHSDERFRGAMIGDPQVPGIDRVTGNEVDYLILVKTSPAAQDAVTRELRRRIKECFESNHIRPGGQTRYYVGEGPAPPQP
ncbi:MAG: mechanosensitive ion channel family protein [Candidatus Korobacteraceae bacterium]